MDHRTAILTEREKEVLRHVHALKTSTQIAYELQLAEVSVNKRIDSARRKLGGVSRRQAAVMLAHDEHGEGYDNLIPPEIVLNDRTEVGAEGSQQNGAIGILGGYPDVPRSIKRGRRNALDIWQRVGVIILSMAGLAAAASVYMALLRS